MKFYMFIRSFILGEIIDIVAICTFIITPTCEHSNKKGDYESAIAFYLRAIQHYPLTDYYHLNETYNNLANVYYQIGEHSKAVAAWKTALEYSPTDKMAQINLQKFGALT